MADKNDLRAKLEEVNGQIADKRGEASKKWEAFEQGREQFAQAGNDANKTDSPEFQAMDKVHKEYTTASAELADLEATRDGIFRVMGVEGQGETPDPSAQRNGSGRKSEETVKSLGERAAESEGFKALVASGALNSDSQRFNHRLAEMSVPELKAALLTGSSDTSGGAFITNDRVGYVPQPRRTRTVLDLITVGQTDGDVVEYARQTAFTNVAAETAEATTTDTGTKPEATIAFEKVTEAVKTIAHWIPATRRALSDVGQLRTLIDSQLRYGLEYRLEAQVVNGNGTGENLTGILQTSNILSQAKGSDSVADAIHKAITQLRLGFVEPNGVALHPNDWQVLRLSRDDGGASAGTGAYLYGPPSMAVEPMIWGLPVAVSAAVPDDTGLVGDFRYATLWLREAIQVLASDSHASFFIQNLIAILAEMRAAFGVTLPAAFAKVTSVD